MGYCDKPIGVFDSGMGGLTVLKELSLRFPNENFVYLGDMARLPYGSKSPNTIFNYLNQNVAFLEKYDVKSVIVACNSASSQLVQRTSEWKIPIYNVIDPGAKFAIEVSLNNNIGILGTTATVTGNAYPNAIHNIEPTAQVTQIAAPLLVPLVEEAWLDDPITNLIAYRYLSPLIDQSVDTIVMGCTHYPLLIDVFRKIVGPDVQLVDSASAIVNEMKTDLKNARWKPNDPLNRGQIRVLSTDFSPGMSAFLHKIMDPVQVGEFQIVDL